jgi:hypothetical protein
MDLLIDSGMMLRNGREREHEEWNWQIGLCGVV